MTTVENIYIKENVIENNIPLRNTEYLEIKNDGVPMYIQGKVNNKAFRYIRPILKKQKKGQSKIKKSVRFKKKLSSTQKVGMPMFKPPKKSTGKKTSKKRRKRS